MEDTQIITPILKKYNIRQVDAMHEFTKIVKAADALASIPGLDEKQRVETFLQAIESAASIIGNL